MRLTLVGESDLPDHLISDTVAALKHVGWLGISEERAVLSGGDAPGLGQSADAPGPSAVASAPSARTPTPVLPDLHVLHIRGTVPPVTLSHEGHDHDQLLRDLLTGWHAVGVAAGFVRGELATAPPKLLVMDVDSTLIPVEVIEQVAAYAGVQAEVEAITTSAMRGEIDFAESLARRVGMLEGVPQSVFAEIAESIDFSPGARTLIDAVHAAGGRVGVVSGGFHEVVDRLVERAGIDLALANRFEVAGGILTGRTSGEVVDGTVKERTLREWAETTGGPVVAIGDGANDLRMMAAADLGVAYHAKPVVAAAADAAIPFRRLDAARAFLGV